MGNQKSKSADYSIRRSSGDTTKSGSQGQQQAYHDGPILGVCVKNDMCYTAAEDKQIGMLNTRTNIQFKNPIEHLQGHEKAVNRVIASGDALWSSSRDLSLRRWDVTTKKSTLIINSAHDLNISAIALNENSPNSIFSGSRDYKVKGWDIEKAVQYIEFSSSRNIVTAMEFDEASPNILFQGSEDLSVKVWDVRSRDRRPVSTIDGYVYFPLCLAVQSQVSHLLATGCKGFNGVGCEIKLWDLRKVATTTGSSGNAAKPVAEFVGGHRQDVTGCKFSSDHRHIISVCKDGTVCVWDTICLSSPSSPSGIKQKPLHTINTPGKYYTCVAVDSRNCNTFSSDIIDRFFACSFDGSISAMTLNKGDSDDSLNENLSIKVLYSSPANASIAYQDSAGGDI